LNGPNAARVIRGVVALGGLLGLVVSFADAASTEGFRALNYFSYFTIESNVLAVVLMGGQAVWPRWMTRNEGLRGAVTLYMTVTLLVYAVLLRPAGVDVGEYRPWVDWIQHTAAPLALLVDWLVVPPARPVSARTAATWLAFPLAFLVWSLLRGPSADFYPYPFLDPRLEGGYGRVAITCLAILMVFVGLAATLRWWSVRRPTGRMVESPG